jgi:hypothetical protein
MADDGVKVVEGELADFPLFFMLTFAFSILSRLRIHGIAAYTFLTFQHRHVRIISQSLFLIIEGSLSLIGLPETLILQFDIKYCFCDS